MKLSDLLLLAAFACLFLTGPFSNAQPSDVKGNLYANTSSAFKISLYSESVYDARFDGAVTETRLRLIPKLQQKWLAPYLGVALSQDLSNGRSPLLIENMVAPTLGVRIRPLKFLYLFTEARQLIRFNNDLRNTSENEIRYGVFAYDYRSRNRLFFNEFYGETVVVDRVDSNPVTVIWNKVGKRFQPYPWLRPDIYTEGFTRISPHPGYGPTENELRFGARVTLIKNFWALSFVAHYSALSDVKPHGVDAMLVISREEF